MPHNISIPSLMTTRTVRCASSALWPFTSSRVRQLGLWRVQGEDRNVPELPRRHQRAADGEEHRPGEGAAGMICLNNYIHAAQYRDPQPVNENNCPVCFERPMAVHVFTCALCANWVCGACKERIVTCPSCRVDINVQPMARNVAMERMLRK